VSDEAQGGQGEMKEIMENNLSLRDKCKCPFCGGTVINTGLDFFGGDVGAAGLRTDAEWICTNCKTEFNSEFYLRSDRIETIYNAKVTLLDKKDCQPNILGELDNDR
jgi:hypothetical protein